MNVEKELSDYLEDRNERGFVRKERSMGDEKLLIYLERHGERADYGGKSGARFVNQAQPDERVDPPLTMAGWQQAKLTASTHWANHPFPDIIITSPFLRCLQTAYAHIQHVENNVGNISLPAVGKTKLCIERGLSEWSPNLFEEEIDLEPRFAGHRNDFPVDNTYDMVWKDKVDFGSESREQAVQRCQKTLSLLVQKYKDKVDSILLVTHQACANAILPPDPARPYATPYCAFSMFYAPLFYDHWLWQNNQEVIDRMVIRHRHDASAWQDNFKMFVLSYKGKNNHLYLRPNEVEEHVFSWFEEDPFLKQFYCGSETGVGVNCSLSETKKGRGDLMFIYDKKGLLHVGTGLYLSTKASPFTSLFAPLILSKTPQVSSSEVYDIFTVVEGGIQLNTDLKFVADNSSRVIGLAPVKSDELEFQDLTFRTISCTTMIQGGDVMSSNTGAVSTEST